MKLLKMLFGSRKPQLNIPTVSSSSTMEFNGCTNLKSVDTSNWVFSKMTKMVMLDEMNFNQVEWCKERGLIENFEPEIAKQLNLCAFYAHISSELSEEFDSL